MGFGPPEMPPPPFFGGEPVFAGCHGNRHVTTHRRMEKPLTDQRVAGCGAGNVPLWWVVIRWFPSVTEGKSLQGLMYGSVEVANPVANILLSFQGFDLIAFLPRNAVSEYHRIAKCLTLMVGAFVTITRLRVATTGWQRRHQKSVFVELTSLFARTSQSRISTRGHPAR